MRPLLRTFLAIVIGCLGAFALVAIIETIGHMLFPVPGRLDMKAPAGAQAAMVIPLPALLSVLVAWSVATFVGGVVAGLLAPSRPYAYAGVVGGVILLGAVANMMMIPHPAWFAVSAVALIVVAAAAAGAVAARRRAGRLNLAR